MSEKNQAKSQSDKFKEAARELETDDSEEHFDERLKRVAISPQPKKGDKPEATD